MRLNQQLSEHFSLYELTKTNNEKLQDENHILSNEQIYKLTKVATLLEACRSILGKPLDVHSGYRCPELNGATAGSSNKSQHMLCEAADFSPEGPVTEESINEAFNKILGVARQNAIKFGQLIVENAQRDYGKVFWIHISLGAPYRELDKCGQVLWMKDGKYTFLEQIKPLTKDT